MTREIRGLDGNCSLPLCYLAILPLYFCSAWMMALPTVSAKATPWAVIILALPTWVWEQNLAPEKPPWTHRRGQRAESRELKVRSLRAQCNTLCSMPYPLSPIGRRPMPTFRTLRVDGRRPSLILLLAILISTLNPEEPYFIGLLPVVLSFSLGLFLLKKRISVTTGCSLH